MEDAEGVWAAWTGPAARIAVLRSLPPLVGVVAFGWQPGDWVAFWFVETVIIGVVNVPRILASRGHPDVDESPADPRGFFSAPFFVVHYGFFVALQSMFLVGTLGDGFDLGAFLHSQDVAVDAAICLGVELVDFGWRGVWRGERDLYSPLGQMFRPYLRIFAQQFTVLLGGWVAILGGGPMGVFAILLVLRAGIEVASPGFDRRFQTSKPFEPSTA